MSSDEDFNENCGKNGQSNNRKRRLIRDDSELDDDGLDNDNFSSNSNNEDFAVIRKKKARVLEESDIDDDIPVAKKRQNCNTEESAVSEDSDENVNSAVESESENNTDDEEGEESEEENETEVLMVGTSESRLLNEIETDSNESDGQSEMCPVCLNKFRGQEIGTPESCDHSFCLECLLEWSRNVNTCPIDRQRFSLIFVRLEFGGKICKRLQVENMFHEDDEQQTEDNTYCEVCGMADREDRLLLCDACDFGYHCECLDPPLEEVPVEEWFCPDCLPTVEANRHSSMPQEVLDDFQEMLNSNFRPGAAVFRRVIPRTRASENVRSRIQRRRIARESADESERVSTNQTLSVPNRKKKIVRRKTRKIKTRKRKRKITKKTKTNNIKKRSTTKRRRKRKKKKTRRSKAASRPLAAPVTVKKRIAEKLGLMKPPVGQTLPVIKRPGPSRTIHSIRSDIGISALSLFGDRDELDVVNDSFEEENGDVCVVRPHRGLQAKAHAKEILSRASLFSRKNVSSVPSPENLQNFDLLGSILQTQSLLHSNAQDITINKDGSLESRYSSLTLKSPNGSVQKRPQDPTSQSTNSKETSTQGYSKSSNISQESISGFTVECISTISAYESSRTSKDNSCDPSASRPIDGQCSSFHSHHHKEKHKHSHKNERKKIQIEEDVDIYSDIESLGEETLLMDEESTDHQFSLPSCANYHVNSHIGNLEEGSDSSENELVIDEDVKDEDHNYSDDENVHVTNNGERLSSENVNDEYNKDKNVVQEFVQKDEREKNKVFNSAEKDESTEGGSEENQENRLLNQLNQIQYIYHKMDKRKIYFGDEQRTSFAECVDADTSENDRATVSQFLIEPREDTEYLVEGKSEEDEEGEDHEDNNEETEGEDQEYNNEETEGINDTEKIETDDDQEQENGKEAEDLDETESTVYNNYQEQNNEGAEYIDEAENLDYDVTEEHEDEDEVVRDTEENEECGNIEEQENEEEKTKEAGHTDKNVKCGDIQVQEDEGVAVAYMDEDENVENEDTQEDEEAEVEDIDEDENVENEETQEDEEVEVEDIDEDENVTNDNVEDEDIKKDSEVMDENKNIYDYDVEEHNIEERNKRDNLDSFDAEIMEEELEETTRTEANRSEKENSTQQEICHSEQYHVMHHQGNSNSNAKFPHQISLNLAEEVEDISEDENEMVCAEDEVGNDCNKNINISYKFSKEGCYSEQDEDDKNVSLLFAEEETNRGDCKKLEAKSRKKHKISCKSHHIHLEDEAEEGEIVEDAPIKRCTERQKHSSRHNEQEEIEDLTDMAPRINVSELPRIPKVKNVEMDLSVEHSSESKRTSVLERIDAGCSDISWKKLSKNSKDRIYRDRKPKDEKLLYQREIKGNKEGNKSYKLELDRWKQDGWSREGSKYQKLDKIQKSETDRWKQDDKSKEGTKSQKSDSDRWKQDDKYKRLVSDRGKERSETDLWKEKADVEVSDHSRFSKEKKVERHLEKSYDRNNERREWRTDKCYDKNDKHDKMYKERHKSKDHKEESNRSKEKEKHRRHSHEHMSEKSRERECRKEEKVKIFAEKHEGRKEKTDKHEKRHHDKGHRHHDHKKRKNKAVSPYSDVTSLDAKEIYAKGDSIIINVNFNRNTVKECEVDEYREDKTDGQSDIKSHKSASITENNTNQKNKIYNDYSKSDGECRTFQNNVLEENTVKQRSKTLKFSEDIWEVTPTEIPLDEDFQLEKDTITMMSDDGSKLESFGFENRNSSDSGTEDDCHKRNVEQNHETNLESSGKENILSVSYDESSIHAKKRNLSRTTFPHSPSYPFPNESDSYDPCEPTKSPTSHHEASYIVKSVDVPSTQEEKPKPPPSPELPPLPTEPEPEEPPLPKDLMTNLNFKTSENKILVGSVMSTSFSSSAVATPHISQSPTFSASKGASVILPNLRVPPPNFVPQNLHSNSSANNGNLLNSGGLPSLNQHVGTAPPHMVFSAPHLHNVMQGGIFSTQPPSSISSANVPGASHLGTGLPPPNSLPVFSQVRSQNIGVNITLPSSVIMTNVPPPNMGLLSQMSLPNLRQPPPPLPASVQGQMYSQSHSIVSQGQIYSQSQGIVSQGQAYSQSQGIVSMTQTKPVSSVVAALLPRVSTTQVTKQQPQEDVTDVVDMDVESPYSPDSPIDSPLLELDEKNVSVSQNNSISVAKDNFESLISSEKVTLSLGKRSHDSSKSKVGKSKNGDHQSLQTFEFQRSIEGHSRQEPATHISKKPKQDCRSETSKHKHCIRFDVIDRSKLSSSVINRKDEKKGVMMKMDESQLKILDELPSSAVEMQVKEKFLKKLNRQERVVEEVKLAVKPYYNRKEITKDEYKEILRKSVPKICHNKSGEINPVKIKALVEGYVKKFKYQRRKSMSGTKLGKTS